MLGYRPEGEVAQQVADYMAVEGRCQALGAHNLFVELNNGELANALHVGPGSLRGVVRHQKQYDSRLGLAGSIIATATGFPAVGVGLVLDTNVKAAIEATMPNEASANRGAAIARLLPELSRPELVEVYQAASTHLGHYDVIG